MDINNLTKQDIINMVDSLPGDFVVCKLNGKKLEMQYCSNTVPGYFGMNSEEFKQANADDAFNVIVESDHEYVFESVDGKPVGPEIIELSFRLKHKSNGFFWAHAKSKIIGKMDGCPVILSNYTNLTNEVSPYSEILDYSDTRIYVIDRHNYEILFMNNVPFCSVIPGTLPIDDNRFCYKMIHGYESPCYSCSMNNVVNTVLENRDIYDKHTKKWLHIKRQAVNWCGHEAIITFMTDISDRIRREQTIMENQQALNSLIKSTPAGKLLHSTCGLNDTIARYGGDEFIVIRQLEPKCDMSDTIKKIENGLSKLNESGKYPFDLSFSYGMACFDPDEDTIDDFLKEMDISMYDDKRAKSKELPDRRKR